MSRYRVTLKDHSTEEIADVDAYQQEGPSQWISSKTGMPAVLLPYTVGGTPEAKDLFGLFDDTLQRLLKGVR